MSCVAPTSPFGMALRTTHCPSLTHKPWSTPTHPPPTHSPTRTNTTVPCKVCESVAQSLVGQKLSSFTGVKAFVLNAFEDSLAGILNKRSVDVLHDVQVR